MKLSSSWKSMSWLKTHQVDDFLPPELLRSPLEEGLLSSSVGFFSLRNSHEHPRTNFQSFSSEFQFHWVGRVTFNCLAADWLESSAILHHESKHSPQTTWSGELLRTRQERSVYQYTEIVYSLLQLLNAQSLQVLTMTTLRSGRFYLQHICAALASDFHLACDVRSDIMSQVHNERGCIPCFNCDLGVKLRLLFLDEPKGIRSSTSVPLTTNMISI